MFGLRPLVAMAWRATGMWRPFRPPQKTLFRGESTLHVAMSGFQPNIPLFHPTPPPVPYVPATRPRPRRRATRWRRRGERRRDQARSERGRGRVHGVSQGRRGSLSEGRRRNTAATGCSMGTTAAMGGAPPGGPAGWGNIGIITGMGQGR